MSGIFNGIKNSAVMALWELAGAFGVNLVANNITSAATITDSTTKDLIKGATAIIPQFFKKQLGAKADLLTAGALLVLGYNVVSNALSSLGLPANIVTMLQDGGQGTTVYVPAPEMQRWLPAGQNGQIARLYPTGTNIGYKPEIN